MEPDLEARLLHRDGMMLVLDKPAGLPVHAGPKGGPNLSAMLDQLRFGLPRPPELAHRLDKDTSGCLVLGRHAGALRRLNALFAEGRVEKTYWAVVEGGPADEAGLVDMALAKKSPTRGWWMRPDPAGLRLSHPRRCDLRHGTPLRWAGAATSCAPGVGAARPAQARCRRSPAA
jgi:tRNA pseudouridine32 synthase / 23S rRNA pseudouridine746 synthase